MMIDAILIGNVLIAGSAVGFLFFAVFATIVFDKPAEDSTAYVPQIEMAMQVKPTDAHIEVWIDAMLPLHTVMDIMNITKLEADGSEEPGALPDLFPLGGPQTGKGSITFSIELMDKKDMPDLSHHTRSVIPMAYVRASTLNDLIKSLLKLSAVSLMFMKLLVVMTILGGLGAMGLGAIIVFLSMSKKPQKEQTTLVEYVQ